METTITVTNAQPIVASLYQRNDLNSDIVVLQTTDIGMQQVLMDSFIEESAYCVETYSDYEYLLSNPVNDTTQNKFYVLLNPTEWEEWEEGLIKFPKGVNVATILIDNSFTASCMADEIWEINASRDAKKLVCPCFF